jgi:fructose-1,6-bisphosphatase/inositol monophosphatase family enzyme
MNEFLEVGIGLAREAGNIARLHFSTTLGRDWKADNTPVTAADLAINSLVIERLSTHFPTHGILGEEQSLLRDGAEFVWVCDPIDGTIPFAHGIPIAAFSLALTKNGEVLLGVVYDFHGDRLCTAVKGGGAFCNGEPISVSTQMQLRPSVTGVEGLWMTGLYDSLDLTRLPSLLDQNGSKLIKLSSTVYEGMLVALGQLGGVVTKTDKPWDLAALKLLIEEAGGRVTDLHGEDQRYDQSIKGAVMTNGPLHRTYLELIEQCQR